MKVSQTLTSLFYLAILALLCVVQCKQEVDAPLPEVDLKKIADNEKPMDDGAVEPWIISFDSDLAETAHFDGVIKWLESNKCAITESVNESYIKFLVANMTKLNGTSIH